MRGHITSNAKKTILALLAFLALIIFFYPKTSCRCDDSFTATASGKSEYMNIQCKCLGLSMLKPGLSRSEAVAKICFGIPFDCSYECRKIINGTWQDVPCQSLEHG